MMETVTIGMHTVRARGLGRGVKVEVPCPSTDGYVDTVRTRQHLPAGADHAVEVCCNACNKHFLVAYQGGGILGITQMRS